MSTVEERGSSGRNAEGLQVTYTGPAVVEVPDAEPRHVDVELLAGRNRWSVGGRIAEGPRWWRGELSWDGEPIDLRAGTQITLELENGRSAMAIVEATPATDAVAVRGIEPPPFAVP
jgi:hypothetical protein